MPPKPDQQPSDTTQLLNDAEDSTRTISDERKAKEDPFMRRMVEEIQEQSKTAWPTLFSMLLTKVPWLISLRFVGMIGVDELAAAALATTIFNVTGISFSVGLSAALRTLAGQAKGELHERLTKQRSRQSKFVRFGALMDSSLSIKTREEKMKESLLPLVYLYRGFFVQMLVVIPIGMWWLIGVGRALDFIGEHRSTSIMTEQYLRILTPALWMYSINWTCTAWLQVIGMAHVPAVAAFVGLTLHAPFNYFFITILGWGYEGSAVATVAYQFVQGSVIFGYVFATKHGRDRTIDAMGAMAIGRTDLSFWREAKEAISSLRGVTQYLALALPGIVAISEWWASETATLLSGRLRSMPEVALGGFSIYQTINSFCFMFPASFGVTASARVSNLLGAGKPDSAKFAGRVSFLSAAAVSSVVGIVLYITPHHFFPSLFAPKEDSVIMQTARTIPYLSVYVVFDGMQNALNGVVTGCGKQSATVPIVIIAYWVVAIPMAYVTAFVHHHGAMYCGENFCGVVALAGSMLTGTIVHFILMTALVFFTINWVREARRANERLSDQRE